MICRLPCTTWQPTRFKSLNILPMGQEQPEIVACAECGQRVAKMPDGTVETLRFVPNCDACDDRGCDRCSNQYEKRKAARSA